MNRRDFVIAAALTPLYNISANHPPTPSKNISTNRLVFPSLSEKSKPQICVLNLFNQKTFQFKSSNDLAYHDFHSIGGDQIAGVTQYGTHLDVYNLATGKKFKELYIKPGHSFSGHLTTFNNYLVASAVDGTSGPQNGLLYLYQIHNNFNFYQIIKTNGNEPHEIASNKDHLFVVNAYGKSGGRDNANSILTIFNKNFNFKMIEISQRYIGNYAHMSISNQSIFLSGMSSESDQLTPEQFLAGSIAGNNFKNEEKQFTPHLTLSNKKVFFSIKTNQNEEIACVSPADDLVLVINKHFKIIKELKIKSPYGVNWFKGQIICTHKKGVSIYSKTGELMKNFPSLKPIPMSHACLC